MEYREDGLMVDFSGTLTRTSSPAQEREMATLNQEVALMRAMTEIRAYTPKSMTPGQRQMFDVMCEKIFAKHGITPQNYQQYFGHLGTTDQLHR